MSNSIMRGRKIGRSITLTECACARVEDGKLVNFTQTLMGQLSAKQAQRYLRSYKHDDSIIVVSVEVDTSYYEASLEDFLEIAEKRGAE